MPKTDDTKTKMVTPPAAAPAPAPTPRPQEYPSNIPKVEGKDAFTGLPEAGGGYPPDSEFKGSYKKKSDGESYALAKVLDDPQGRTHKLKNTLHSWEGTEAEFKDQFDVDEKDDK